MKIPDIFSNQLFTFLLLIREKIYKQFEGSYNDRLTSLQFHVIATLGMYGGMTMSSLAKKMNLQKQSATKVVNQLVGMDFIRRFNDEADRRIIKVENTPEAKAYLDRFSIENMKQVSRYFASLSNEEFMELQKAIETVNRILPHVSVKDKKSL